MIKIFKRNDIRIEKKCIICNQPFMAKAKSNPEHKCCSVKCRKKEEYKRYINYYKDRYIVNRENVLKKAKAYQKNNRERLRIYLNKYRHLKGIHKNFLPRHGLSKTKEYKKFHDRKYRFLGGGKITVSLMQQIYEDNIKQYGTLTCYLCLKPVEFGKDCIEHKQPLSRGGTNEYSNLAIACRSCNCKKYNKTEKEYLFLKNTNA